MSIRCAVGKGKHLDFKKAAAQAVVQVKDHLQDVQPDLLWLWASVVYSQQLLLNEMNDAFPGVPLLGCSTAGEIFGDTSDEHSLVLVGLTGIHAHLAMGLDLAEGSEAAGRRLGEQFANRPGELMLVMCDGLTGDGAAILRGLHLGLGKKLPIVGGAAGDDSKFQKTQQYFGAKVVSGQVIAAVLEGDFQFGIGVRHGWQPVGLPVTVTKARGNELFELNHLPASRFFEEYMGEYASRLGVQPFGRLAIQYPLGLAVENSEEFLLRAATAVEPGRVVRCTAEVPEGALVRLMIGSVEDALRAARRAATEALAQMQGRVPKLVMIFNCLARRRLFGQRAGEEIAVVREIFGHEVPVVGFYTYGEIAPLEGRRSELPSFHNETIVILTLG